MLCCVTVDSELCEVVLLQRHILHSRDIVMVSCVTVCCLKWG